nr:hypothetical protein [Tanacetum cinerariifolium]
MSTQQDIYAAGSESRPPMLNKENYVPWSSRLLRYAKSRPNGKLIHNSILNGPYIRKMIPEPGDANRKITVTETFHLQTDDELSDKELKQIEADDQAIQTILLGLPEDIYAARGEHRSKTGPRPRWSKNLDRGPDRNGTVRNQIGNGNLVAARAEGNTAGQNGNQIRHYNCRGVGHYARNCTVRPRRMDAAYLQTQLLIAQKEEAGIQLQAEECDLMAVAADLDKIEEVNVNCILMANLQQASTSGTQTDSAPVYNTDGSAKNDNNVISKDTSMEQGGETVEQHPANFKETRALYESLYQNLAIEVEKVNSVNHKLKETNADMTTELARYKNQERCFEISQEKYDKLERCYQQSVYQEQFKYRTQLFKKVSDQKDNTQDTSKNTKFAKQPIMENLPKIGETNALSKPVTSNSVSTPQQSKGVNNDKVIALGMFRINPSKTSREEKHVPNTVSASARTKPITVSQPHVITKKNVNSNLNGLSSTGVDNTKTRRPQPRSNTNHDRVPSASKSSRSKNKETEVKEHHRNLLLSKNNKHISSVCNNIQIDSQDVISKVVCAMCKKCLISVNHDKCLRNYVNGKNSRGKKQNAKVSFKENQMKYQPKVTEPKKIENHKSLATPKPRKSRLLLRWSPTGKLFVKDGKIVDSNKSKSQFDCSNGDNACCSKHMTGNLKLLINFVWKFMGTARFRNDHVAFILGFGDLQWGNILITRVYFIEGLGHNLLSVGQFCDFDLEIAFRRDACFVRNLEGVDLLKGDRSTTLYTINLHEMASASPICLMARAFSTKSWLWHQRLSHLNFDTINDLARNDLIAGLPKFKYHKEHLCPFCEQGKSKRASHLPKPVLNSRSKDDAPAVIITFLKRITVLLQSPVIIIRTNNGTEFKNQVLKEYFDTVGISHQIIYNQRTKKIIETMNVSFDELLAMAFEQHSSKPGLQSMTSRHISSGLDLTYAPSTITTQQPSEGELDLLFEAMYDDYIGGQPSTTGRTILPAQEPQYTELLEPIHEPHQVPQNDNNVISEVTDMEQ